MRTISAAEFKARCLTLMDDVNSTRETLVITKRGACGGGPAGRRREFIGRLKGMRLATDATRRGMSPRFDSHRHARSGLGGGRFQEAFASRRIGDPQSATKRRRGDLRDHRLGMLG